MLYRCKSVAARTGLDPARFDLKTFRSTYATGMLRRKFDLRTVQYFDYTQLARATGTGFAIRQICTRRRLTVVLTLATSHARGDQHPKNRSSNRLRDL